MPYINLMKITNKSHENYDMTFSNKEFNFHARKDMIIELQLDKCLNPFEVRARCCTLGGGFPLCFQCLARGVSNFLIFPKDVWLLTCFQVIFINQSGRILPQTFSGAQAFLWLFQTGSLAPRRLPCHSVETEFHCAFGNIAASNYAKDRIMIVGFGAHHPAPSHHSQ